MIAVRRAACVALALVADPGGPTHWQVAIPALFVAAAVCGVAGFAFSALAFALAGWCVPDPVAMVGTFIVCSIAIQVYSVARLCADINARALTPFVLGELDGTPPGTWMLLHFQAVRLVYPLAMMLRHFSGLVLGMSCLLPGSTWGQDTPFLMNPGAFSNYMAIQPMRERLEQSHRTIFGQPIERSLRSSDSGSARSKPPSARADAGTTSLAPTTFKPTPGGAGQRMSRTMAQPYPEASRDQAEKLFEQLLTGFKQIESHFGLPSNDVAAAVAALLVGSYSVYRNTSVPDEHFLPLVKQMRLIMSSTPAFVQASAAEKQATYEQLAILGTLMATTKMALDRQPDAKVAFEARQAAAGYLRSFLDTDPERVRLSATGLEIR